MLIVGFYDISTVMINFVFKLPQFVILPQTINNE